MPTPMGMLITSTDRGEAVVAASQNPARESLHQSALL